MQGHCTGEAVRAAVWYVGGLGVHWGNGGVGSTLGEWGGWEYTGGMGGLGVHWGGFQCIQRQTSLPLVTPETDGRDLTCVVSSLTQVSETPCLLPPTALPTHSPLPHPPSSPHAPSDHAGPDTKDYCRPGGPHTEGVGGHGTPLCVQAQDGLLV